MPELCMGRGLGAAVPRAGGDRPPPQIDTTLLGPCSTAGQTMTISHFLSCPWGCWGSWGHLGSAGRLCHSRWLVSSLPHHGTCGAWPLHVFPSCSAMSPGEGNERFLVQSLCSGPEHKQPVTEDKMDTSQAGAPKFSQ